MVYEDFLNPGQVKAIIDKPVEWEQGKTLGTEVATMRIVKLADITHYINLRNIVYDCIKELNAQTFNYDITRINQMNLLRYDVGGKYDYHQDVNYSSQEHRKITFIIQLSDPNEYEGGTLEFRDGPFKGEGFKKMGSIMIFPSFLYHRITPVTKGIRHSIVGWAVGPRWR